MIRKLFGTTDEEQFRYLLPRLVALGVGVALLLIGVLLMQIGVPFGKNVGSFGVGICVIVLMVFGWSIMKGIFGYVSLGALFSGNIVIGILIFVLYLMLGYFGGFFVAFIGLCRFFVLLKKRKGNN